MDFFKLMQVIKAVLLGLTYLVSGVVMVLPYWFEFSVQISWDAGRTMQTKTMDVGLFYMDKGDGTNMIDLIFVDKASNAHTFPGTFRVAQIFYALGNTSSFVCFIVSLIYFCRKYKTPTGEMCLAGVLLPTTFSLLLGVVFAALAGTIKDKDAWEAFPVPDNYMQVKADPEISLGVGLYIATFAAFLSLASLILAWIQACILCRHVENVRYQMLNAPLTEDERGVCAVKPLGYGRDAGFRYDGYGKPGRGTEVDF